MTLPANSIAVTPGSGATVATQTIGGKDYQVMIVADDSGHLAQSVPSYTFYIKNQAGGGPKVHFDIFNTTTGLLELRGLWISPHLSGTAVTGAVSPDFDLFRTSAVGTGGTTIGANGASFPTIASMDSTNTALPAGVTVRAAPTGGATSAVALCSSYVTQEETNAGAQMGQWFNVLPVTMVGQRYAARQNQGFKLTQATLGVTQGFSFYVMFTYVP